MSRSYRMFMLRLLSVILAALPVQIYAATLPPAQAELHCLQMAGTAVHGDRYHHAMHAGAGDGACINELDCDQSGDHCASCTHSVVAVVPPATVPFRPLAPHAEFAAIDARLAQRTGPPAHRPPIIA